MNHVFYGLVALAALVTTAMAASLGAIYFFLPRGSASQSGQLDLVQQLQSDGNSSKTLSFAYTQVLKQATAPRPSPVSSVPSAPREDEREIIETLSLSTQRKTSADVRLDAYVEGLNKFPHLALTVIYSDLQSLAYQNNSSVLRGNLLRIAQNFSSSSGEERQRLSNFALGEASSDVMRGSASGAEVEPLASKQFYVLGAYQVFIETTDDPRERYSGTYRAIVSQSDPEVRSSIARRFLERFPDYADQLQAELARQQIQIDNGNPRVPAGESDNSYVPNDQ